MIKKPITVKVSQGLDARPIALLVQEASKYSSQVFIETKDNKTVNAKSIMGMMSLKMVDGEEFVVVAEGTDEEDAANGIEAFLEKTK